MHSCANTCQQLTGQRLCFPYCDMWLEAAGCLVGTEAAGGTPPSRLRLLSAAHAQWTMNPGPDGGTGWCAFIHWQKGPSSSGGCRWVGKRGRRALVYDKQNREIRKYLDFLILMMSHNIPAFNSQSPYNCTVLQSFSVFVRFQPEGHIFNYSCGKFDGEQRGFSLSQFNKCNMENTFENDKIQSYFYSSTAGHI